MDLLSSIRKSGSRGGVNFSWDDVQSSQHRENYLGHSLMAPVGRWQKNKDLSWYAKGDEGKPEGSETAEEKQQRERKEEIKRIKEAEEDALARALGLPVKERNVTGSNAIAVRELNRVVKEAGVGVVEEGDREDTGRGKGFGEFVGKVNGAEGMVDMGGEPQMGGLVGEKEGKRVKRGEERSRSRERRHRHRLHRSHSGGRHRRRHRDDREERRPRSRSLERRERRNRSRSPERRRGRGERDDRKSRNDRPRRSRSPDDRERRHRGSDRRR